MQLNLDELIAQARALVDEGDLVGARELLNRALADADPHPANATAQLTEAADLCARVLVALDAPDAARPWASYAYAAATRLFGSADPRTLSTGEALAAILYRVGSTGSRTRSARLYLSLIEEMTAIEGPESPRVLYAQSDLAVLEHLRGDQVAALDRMEEVWQQYNGVYGEDHPGAIRMLARLGALERDGNHPELAVEHLALARAAGRAQLGDDHPVVRQISAFMARGSTRRERDGSPLTVVTDAHTSVPPPRAPYDDAEMAPSERAYGPPGWPPAIADPLTNDLPYRSQQSTWPGEAAAATAEPWPPDDPAVPAADAAGAGPGAGAATGAAAGAGAGAATGTAAAAGRARTGGGWGWDRVRTWRVIRQRQPRSAETLFVGRRGDQGLLPVVIAALVVLLLGTIAVAAGFALVNNDEPAPVAGPTAAPVVTVSPQITTVAPPAPAPTTAVAPPAGQAPPTGFAVNDSRDAVTLNWTYPPGATGPVVISAGQPGREPRLIGEQPAGSTSYVVHGLPPNTNFCFSVGVRYAADTVKAAPTVCTNRTGG